MSEGKVEDAIVYISSIHSNEKLNAARDLPPSLTSGEITV